MPAWEDQEADVAPACTCGGFSTHRLGCPLLRYQMLQGFMANAAERAKMASRYEEQGQSAQYNPPDMQPQKHVMLPNIAEVRKVRNRMDFF